MNNKDIIIILLICIIGVLSASVMYVFMQPNQTQLNTTNNTNTSVNVEKVAQEDESSNSASSSSSNGGIHKEHLNGGDVGVDSNGRVVGHYYQNGDYIQGGQLEGMSIEEARAFDDHVSKYGMQ